MDSSRCSTANVSSSPASTISSCSYSSANRSCTCNLGSNLSGSTSYTFTFSNFTDTAGNALSGHTLSFTTAATADTTAPTVASSDPANGSTNFLICGPLYVCFSETIDSAQCTTANATYDANAFPPSPAGFSYCWVTGTTGCSSKSGTCTGTEFEWGLDWATACGNTARSGGGQTWNTNRTYTATIRNVADPSGNVMTSTTFTFTTGNN